MSRRISHGGFVYELRPRSEFEHIDDAVRSLADGKPHDAVRSLCTYQHMHVSEVADRMEEVLRKYDEFLNKGKSP